MTIADVTDTLSTNNSHRLRARIVFPGDAAPIECGTIVIESGRIVEVHTRPDSAAVDLGNVAVIPGLINVHTHLEFSDLAEPLSPPNPFLDWIRAVVTHRRARVEPTAAIIARGVRESIASGTTTLGEIATDDDVGSATAGAATKIVRFRELIGFAAGQIEPQLEIARRHLTSEPGDRVLHGISPHAPYSVHPELFRGLVRLAVEQRAPIAMHLAETLDEIEFLESGSGPFVELLKQFGIWEPEAVSPGTRPLEYLRELAKADSALAIHGNYLNDDELDFLAGNPHVALVYCPRTHAYFGHSRHPWRELNARGGLVAIGTDSRASNPDLSLWRELQFLHERNPDLGVAELIQYGTINGACALGIDNETGSLSPDKSADLAIISLDDDARSAELFARGRHVNGVMIAGRWIHKIA